MRRPTVREQGSRAGHLIAIAILAFTTALGAQGGTRTQATVERFGTGVAGSFGVPKVTLQGQILAGHEVTFGTRFGLANAPALIGFGSRQAPAIIPGFQLPLHVNPVATIGMVLDHDGVGQLASTLPLSAALVGSTFALQAFLADPLAAHSVSASRGVEIVIGGNNSAPPRVLPIAKEPLDRPRVAQQVDLNGDNVLDVLAGGPTLGYVLGNGDGTFAPLATIPGYSIIGSLAAGDFDGDGNQDFACLENFGNLLVGFGQGNLTFAPPTSLGTSSINTKLLAADVNGDGADDLLIGTNKLSVRLADGVGGFGPATDYEVGQSSSQVAAMRLVDWDGDSFDDVVIGTTGDIRVFRGRSNGHLRKGARINARGDTVDVGDFNSDGVMDIAAVSVNKLHIFYMLANGTYSGSYDVVVDDPARLIKDFVTGRFSNQSQLDIAVLSDRAHDSALLILHRNDAIGWAATNELTTMVAIGYRLFHADHDGDGETDFAAIGYVSNDVALAIGKGDGTVHRATTSDLPPFPGALAVGDLNRDGWPDAITAKAIATGSAAGFVVGPGLPPEATPAQVQLATLHLHDLDGDGDLDAIGQGPHPGQGPTRVLVWLNHGDGSFAQPVAVFSGGSLQSLTVGDIDGDSIPDLALPTDLGPTFLRGNGDGSYAPLSTGTSFNTRSIALGDINQDGHADAALLHRLSTVECELQLLLGDSTGSFTTSPLPFFPRFDGTPADIKLADYNGDGRADVIVATSVSMPFEPGVWVLLGVVGNNLLAPPERLILQTTQGIAIGDFNDDGYDDVAAVHRQEAELSIAYGAASIGATPRVEQYAVSQQPQAAHFVDVDGDGDLDIVVVDNETGDLVVMHNSAVR